MKSKLVLIVFFLLSLLAIIWSLALAIRSHRIAEWHQYLLNRGFPESYAVRLAGLNYEHPKWVFVPLPVNDMRWNEVVDKECSPSWNLVVHSSWAPPGWEQLGVTNYTPYYADNAKAYDSGAWYQASRTAIAYFMDPRNFLNETDVFMFETLGFDAASQTEEAVERTLSRTFMAGAKYDGGDRTFSRLLMDIGGAIGVSPVFLAGRLASEQGEGSVQARGKIGDSLFELSTNATGRVGDAVVWGKVYTRNGERTRAVLAKGAKTYNGYYNFFNFGAYGLGLFEIRYNAWREAVANGWTSQALAIEGGARKLKERYIDTHRHTRYLQKFSVLPAAKDFRWKQYMQNIAAPLVEARNTSSTYAQGDALDVPYRFLIPVYRDMPSVPSADPAAGRSVYSPSEE